MKKFSNYPIYESKVIDNLVAKLPDSNVIKDKIYSVSKVLGPKSVNALYLTMVFAYNITDTNIVNDAETNVLQVIAQNKLSYISSLSSQLEKLDTNSFDDYKDNTNEALWLIYKTYLAKTIAKEENSTTQLDILNKYLRSFKNSWEISWGKIEDSVQTMHSDVSKEELENTTTSQPDEITNLEQTTAVEDAIKDEDKLLGDLIKRAGLNKNTLKEYVNIVINRTFKTVDNSSNEPVIKWKNKIAKGEPVDSDFILGISAMICGAFITKDKTTIKEILGYLDNKTQDDLIAAKNKLMK